MEWDREEDMERDFLSDGSLPLQEGFFASSVIFLGFRIPKAFMLSSSQRRHW